MIFETLLLTALSRLFISWTPRKTVILNKFVLFLVISCNSIWWKCGKKYLDVVICIIKSEPKRERIPLRVFNGKLRASFKISKYIWKCSQLKSVGKLTNRDLRTKTRFIPDTNFWYDDDENGSWQFETVKQSQFYGTKFS